jgi:hypothetical protein
MASYGIREFYLQTIKIFIGFFTFEIAWVSRLSALLGTICWILHTSTTVIRFYRVQ